MKLMPECLLNNKANDNLVSLSCHPCCFIIVVVLIISYPFPSTFCPIPLLFLLHLQLFLLLHHTPPLFFFPHSITPLVSLLPLQGTTHFTFSLCSPDSANTWARCNSTQLPLSTDFPCPQTATQVLLLGKQKYFLIFFECYFHKDFLSQVDFIKVVINS